MSMDKHTFIHKFYSFIHEIHVFLKANHCIYISTEPEAENRKLRFRDEKIKAYSRYYFKPHIVFKRAFRRIFNNYFPKSSCKFCNFVISFIISVLWGNSLENFVFDQKNFNIRVCYFYSSFYVHLHARYQRQQRMAPDAWNALFPARVLARSFCYEQVPFLKQSRARC